MKDLITILEKLNSTIDDLSARITVVEQSVNDSLTRATKAERSLYGEPQAPKPRPLQPAQKGSIAAKSLGLG